jgi:hypothetical protein
MPHHRGPERSSRLAGVRVLGLVRTPAVAVFEVDAQILNRPRSQCFSNAWKHTDRVDRIEHVLVLVDQAQRLLSPPRGEVNPGSRRGYVDRVDRLPTDPVTGEICGESLVDGTENRLDAVERSLGQAFML